MTVFFFFAYLQPVPVDRDIMPLSLESRFFFFLGSGELSECAK